MDIVKFSVFGQTYVMNIKPSICIWYRLPFEINIPSVWLYHHRLGITTTRTSPSAAISTMSTRNQDISSEPLSVQSPHDAGRQLTPFADSGVSGLEGGSVRIKDEDTTLRIHHISLATC